MSTRSIRDAGFKLALFLFRLADEVEAEAREADLVPGLRPPQSAASFIQNLILKGLRLQGHFLEPGFRGVGIREDLEVIGISDLFAGVDIRSCLFTIPVASCLTFSTDRGFAFPGWTVEHSLSRKLALSESLCGPLMVITSCSNAS